MWESEEPVLQSPSKLLISSTMILYYLVLHAFSLSFVNRLAEVIEFSYFMYPTTNYGGGWKRCCGKR